MGRFQEYWDDYERRVVPNNAGPQQRRETKRAFYAGALVVVQAQLDHCENFDPDIVSEAEVEAFDAMVQEIQGELAAMAMQGGTSA